MSREDPIVVQIDRKSVRYVRGTAAKRQCRDADIIISAEGMVIKDRFGPGFGMRAATPEEKAKATAVYSE